MNSAPKKRTAPYQGKFDPLTRKPLAEGGLVVRCQGCLAYHLLASWQEIKKCANCGNTEFWKDREKGFFAEEDEVEDAKRARKEAPPVRVPQALGHDGPQDGKKRRIKITPGDVGNETPRKKIVVPTEDPDPAPAPILWKKAYTVTVTPPAPISEMTTATRLSDRSRIEGSGWSTSILQKARVLVVGTGAVGNEVLKNLLLVGLGNIVVVDLDTVDASNLTRAILFSPEDIGKSKALAVAERMMKMEARISVHPLQGTLTDLFGLGAYRRFDLVFCCVDNKQARIDVARSCLLTRTPMIEGGVDKLDGNASIWFPPETACYDCGLTDRDRKNAGKRTSCPGVVYGEADRPSMPFTPTATSIVGGMMVQWGLQALHGGLDRHKAVKFTLNSEANYAGFSIKKPAVDCPTHRASRENPDDADSPCILPVDHQIMVCEQWTLDTTVAEVFSKTRALRKWKAGGMELQLGFHQFAPTATCPACGRTFPLKKRWGQIYPKDLECPECKGDQAQPDYIGSDRAGYITPDSPYAGWKLRDLGMKPYDIFYIKDNDPGGSGETICFEAAGHGEEIFGNTGAELRRIERKAGVSIADNRGGGIRVVVKYNARMKDILPGLIKAAKLEAPGPGMEWRIANQTRGVTYGPDDSLAASGADDGDALAWRVVLTGLDMKISELDPQKRVLISEDQEQASSGPAVFIGPDGTEYEAMLKNSTCVEALLIALIMTIGLPEPGPGKKWVLYDRRKKAVRGPLEIIGGLEPRRPACFELQAARPGSGGERS